MINKTACVPNRLTASLLQKLPPNVLWSRVKMHYIPEKKDSGECTDKSKIIIITYDGNSMLHYGCKLRTNWNLEQDHSIGCRDDILSWSYQDPSFSLICIIIFPHLFTKCREWIQSESISCKCCHYMLASQELMKICKSKDLPNDIVINILSTATLAHPEMLIVPGEF